MLGSTNVKPPRPRSAGPDALDDSHLSEFYVAFSIMLGASPSIYPANPIGQLGVCRVNPAQSDAGGGETANFQSSSSTLPVPGIRVQPGMAVQGRFLSRHDTYIWLLFLAVFEPQGGAPRTVSWKMWGMWYMDNGHLSSPGRAGTCRATRARRGHLPMP